MFFSVTIHSTKTLTHKFLTAIAFRGGSSYGQQPRAPKIKGAPTLLIMVLTYPLLSNTFICQNGN